MLQSHNLHQPIIRTSLLPRAKRTVVSTFVVAGLSLAVWSCSAARREEVIGRFGSVALTRGAVEHQMALIAGERAKGMMPGHRPPPEQEALEELISARWVIGEARARHLAQSWSETERKERLSFPGGEAEFKAFLRATGESPADATFDATRRLAASRLRAAILSRVAPVTRGDALRYFRAHRLLYVLPARREVLITNRKSRAAARLLEAEVAGGMSFGKVAMLEVFALRRDRSEVDPHLKLERAIFRAPTNVLTGPVKERVDYFVFEVTRRWGATRASFGSRERRIVARLEDGRRRAALSRVVTAMATRWRTEGDCKSRQLVEACEGAERRARDDLLGAR